MPDREEAIRFVDRLPWVGDPIEATNIREAFGKVGTGEVLVIVADRGAYHVARIVESLDGQTAAIHDARRVLSYWSVHRAVPRLDQLDRFDSSFDEPPAEGGGMKLTVYTSAPEGLDYEYAEGRRRIGTSAGAPIYAVRVPEENIDFQLGRWRSGAYFADLTPPKAFERDWTRTREALARYDEADAAFARMFEDYQGPGTPGPTAQEVAKALADLERLGEAVGAAFGLDTSDINDPETCRQCVRPGRAKPAHPSDLSFVRRAVAGFPDSVKAGGASGR